MTKDEATKIVTEINELIKFELFDTHEYYWVILLKAELLQGRRNPENYHVCVRIKPLNDDSTITVPYNYFKEHIKMNKPEPKPILNL
ncbi:MAG: hypothetical protein KAR20_07920 [Candidatus Heimdallarchaeota archaeon]|nr:hypothetical protein [Candidatus Heimdallarchaeota archaeon]